MKKNEKKKKHFFNKAFLSSSDGDVARDSASRFGSPEGSVAVETNVSTGNCCCRKIDGHVRRSRNRDSGRRDIHARQQFDASRAAGCCNSDDAGGLNCVVEKPKHASGGERWVGYRDGRSHTGGDGEEDIGAELSRGDREGCEGSDWCNCRDCVLEAGDHRDTVTDDFIEPSVHPER